MTEKHAASVRQSRGETVWRTGQIPPVSEERRAGREGREARARFQKACAIAHGVGAGMSANDLMDYVCEHGLPAREERERMLAAKLAEDEGTTPPLSPS